MDINYSLFIKASPEKVYEALATSKGINGWWSKDCIVGERTGEKSVLKFNKQGNIVTMGFKTETLEPGKKVVWECIENANPAWLGTRIVTEINGGENGSGVLFSHRGFDDKWAGQDAFEMTKQGWDHFTQSLVAYCQNGAESHGNMLIDPCRPLCIAFA